jgi:hypothetical protein
MAAAALGQWGEAQRMPRLQATAISGCIETSRSVGASRDGPLFCKVNGWLLKKNLTVPFQRASNVVGGIAA